MAGRGGLVFYVDLGFVNFRYFFHSWKMMFDTSYDHKDGEVSTFQALMASLSGTVGLGNIAGVAVAVTTGGPGACVWMIVMGLFSMSTKYAETHLGVKYRRHASAEHPQAISGGPMYYLRDAFDKHNLPLIGKFMAGLFAVCCIGGAIGGGNMFQANQAYQQALEVTGGADSFLVGYGWLFGLFLAALVGVVIIGGIKSIGNVAGWLVPGMAVVYMGAGAVVLAMHFTAIPQAFTEIIHSAFSLEAGFGGLLGGILVGVQRAAFSNEAGLGSAPIVHCTAKTDTPAQQAMVSMMGPFIDTVIICTMTALVITVTGVHRTTEGLGGVELTSAAFASGISWFPYVLAVAVFLFAYSTLITWAYYGIKATTYLFGEHDWIELTFKLIFCGFVVVGASAQLSNIISFTDAMILSMGIPNIIGLYLLAPEIKADMKAYIAKIKKA
ncbi:MAG: alanine:cation symporter family protein [Alphaproteobacteria bacterium]|nr:alanine:cation symporter family protein [Alphaproteobacteria bacterium]